MTRTRKTMKKLIITKERYQKSKYLQEKYGKLKFISESGNVYKTDKNTVLELVTEAKEYIDDDSIDAESAEEFIIFDDPNIFNQIANVQKKEDAKVEKEIEQKDIDNQQDVAKEVQKQDSGGGGPTIGREVASAAITGTTNIITNPTVIGLAAAAVGAGAASGSIKKVVDDFQNLQKTRQSNSASQQLLQKHKDEFAKQGINTDVLYKGQNYVNSLSDEQMKQLGFDKIPDEGYMHNMEYHKLVAQGLPEKERKSYLQNAMSLCDKYGSKAVSAGTSAAGAISAGTTSGLSGTTLFGMSLATIGWIAAGVAAAAIITPYIYDKVRACTKTWMADIIAETKFKADGKNYRCFYDLKDNKWVVTYADVKWTSYMDNKLDEETQEAFFKSNFFKKFLDKCKQTFAFLFSTGKNEVVFKTLPEIKDAPKELKNILEKIYDNKGAITKNLFTGKH